jgi:hypothetical protein
LDDAVTAVSTIISITITKISSSSGAIKLTMKLFLQKRVVLTVNFKSQFKIIQVLKCWEEDRDTA